MTRTLLLVLFSLCVAMAPSAHAECAIQPDWKIETARVLGNSSQPAKSYAELADRIEITSTHLPDFRKCANANNPLVLYLGGMPLKGMAEYPPSDPSGQTALYTLTISPDNRQVWNKLLGSPTVGELRPMAVSIGLTDGFALPSNAVISLQPVPPGWFALWAAFFLGGVIIFFYLVRRTRVLRGGTPVGGEAFSISRSQAAWWFFLVLAAYLLIGLVTGDYTSSLNSTALSLLGIASATYLASAAVDASKSTPEQIAARTQERARLQAIQNRSPAEQEKLRRLNGESLGWFNDVLSDSEGIDFHRFQMLVWTFVLGIIFVTRVWQELAMPDFNTTLLGLMGLSAGTYVGLKIPETTS